MRIIIDAPESIVIPNVEGLHNVYFDDDSILYTLGDDFDGSETIADINAKDIEVLALETDAVNETFYVDSLKGKLIRHIAEDERILYIFMSITEP